MAVMDLTPFDVIGCPECQAPAEVVDRFELQSTSGPLLHTATICANKHRLVSI